MSSYDQQYNYNDYYPQQDNYYPQQDNYYPQQSYNVATTPAATVSKTPKESWRKKYFSWCTPAIIIWFVLAFLICIAAYFTVGCEFSSVPHACATWSFNCTYGF